MPFAWRETEAGHVRPLQNLRFPRTCRSEACLARCRSVACLALSLLVFAVFAWPQATVTNHSLTVKAGMGSVIDSPSDIRRVAISSGEIAEAVVATPREILVNGKQPGETSLIVWLQNGSRTYYSLKVLPNDEPLQAVRNEIRDELVGQKIRVDFENGVPIVRGTATNLTIANRALALAGTLGKPVNLLKVDVPQTDPQILLKIKFADVDRSAAQNLGFNFFTNGTGNTVGSVSTQQFSPPTPGSIKTQNGAQNASSSSFTLSDALNVFLFRTDLNLGATIRALESKSLLQILAEPNVLTLDRRPASFLAGGEFPFPTLQGGGAGLGAVTIQFREFGIRLNFTPFVTPRGTIRLVVNPEVSSLDYANALVVQGYTIPALSTRRISTEVELESGQSFAIAGLLDNRVTETLNNIPGVSKLPVLGKLFQSKTESKTNSELLVVVTPEIVYPIPAGKHVPDVHMPRTFLPPNTAGAMRTSPAAVTGVAPPRKLQSIPMEELIRDAKESSPNQGQQQQSPSLQFVPMVFGPQPPSAASAGQTNVPPAATQKE